MHGSVPLSRRSSVTGFMHAHAQPSKEHANVAFSYLPNNKAMRLEPLKAGDAATVVVAPGAAGASVAAAATGPGVPDEEKNEADNELALLLGSLLMSFTNDHVDSAITPARIKPTPIHCSTSYGRFRNNLRQTAVNSVTSAYPDVHISTLTITP